MKIQINSDNHIDVTERLAAFVREEVESALNHYNDQVTRVEVHLGDENSDKEGARDKRCMMEVRIARLQPIAVTDHADSLEKAIASAANKVHRAVGNSIGKLGK